MGNFYTNISINKEYSDQINNVITNTIESGYIIKSGGWVTICSGKIEQNAEFATAIMNKITKETNTLGVMFLNHDDDILMMNISINGKTVFQYNSDPDYFSGGSSGVFIEGIDNLNKIKDLGDEAALLSALKTKDDTFAIEKQEKLCSILNFPKSSLGASSEYLDGDDYPQGVSKGDVYEIGL